jgi:zinc transport system ATP-binding protein
MALISCKNASFGYEGTTVLANVSLDVNAGDYLCLAGPNGSGKSTLIRGLLKLKSPKSGSVTFGEGLTFEQIGYLPQTTTYQKDFPASVMEVTLSGRLGLKGAGMFYTKRDKQAAKENLNKLGVCDLSSKCYRELSGGQQRRVLIARALCAASRLLILDEPTAGLDPAARDEFYDMLDALNHEGLTVLTVSHDVNCCAHKELRIVDGELKLDF